MVIPIFAVFKSIASAFFEILVVFVEIVFLKVSSTLILFSLTAIPGPAVTVSPPPLPPLPPTEIHSPSGSFVASYRCNVLSVVLINNCLLSAKLLSGNSVPISTNLFVPLRPMYW